jgi:hypothetical protein
MPANADVPLEQGSVKTQPVRIKVLLNAAGEWAAYGYNECERGDPDEVLCDMMSDKETDTARMFWVNAELPLPVAECEIEATGIAEVPTDG